MREAFGYDVDLLKALDSGEWERLQRDYFSRVYYFVKRQVGDPEAAEDVTSETFLGALKGIDRFDPRFNVEQYLFGIARKKSIDWLRRGGREVNVGQGEDDSESFFGRAPSTAPTPEVASLAREKIERQRDALVGILRDYVGELWEKRDFQRLRAIELVFLCQWKHRPVAELLGYQDEKSVAGVKFRAIREFQDRLRQRDPNRSLFSKLWEQ